MGNDLSKNYNYKTAKEKLLLEDSERRVLRLRKNWLLLQSKDFINELKEALKSNYEKICWQTYPVEVVLEWKNLRKFKNAKTRNNFFYKYDFVPDPSDKAHNYDIIKLRKFAKECGFYTPTFERHRRWFEMAQESKNMNELKGKILRCANDWIFIEIQVLNNWLSDVKKSDDIGRFRNLAKICRENRIDIESLSGADKLKILYILGRLNHGKPGANIYYPIHEFPSCAKVKPNFEADKLGYIHINQRWLSRFGIKESYESEEKRLQELKSEYQDFYADYIDDRHHYGIQIMIRKAKIDMEKKIKNAFEYFNINK